MTEQELVDFLKWHCETPYTQGEMHDTRLRIRRYLKSTNSNEPNERESVGKNEHQKEDFYKKKYEKCIEVIKRFDAGIIGMYDL